MGPAAATALVTAARALTTTGGRCVLVKPPVQPSLLACNVYISAGKKPSHERILLELLREAQAKCSSSSADVQSNNGITAEPEAPPVTSSSSLDDSSLSFLSPSQQKLLLSSAKLPPVMVVHAYADPVYNRSSFHLAGTKANAIADVASKLAISAIQMLQQENDGNNKVNDDNSHLHPFVGYVDHVSVMPLVTPTEQDDDGDDDNQSKSDSQQENYKKGSNEDDDFQPISASGWAARAVGRAMMESNTTTTTTNGDRLVDEVYYYGDADPLGTPLATVRRERTRFFRTGGCVRVNDNKNDTTAETSRLQDGVTDSTPKQQQQVATVGAPPEFVENYNIRLTRHCSKAVAQSLTRHVRECNGGLVNVEALTLPYSRGRWEVACNLLRPNTSTTARQVEMAVQEWERQQMTPRLDDDHDDEKETFKLVEQGYRVGTTTEQCLKALISCADDTEKRRRHDEMVALKLKEFLQQE